MPDHPTDVRRTKEHVLVAHVPERLEVIVRPDHVPAMHVQHALGFPRGATGVEDVERVLSVHHLRRTLDTLTLHELVEVQLACCAQYDLRRLAAVHNHCLDIVQATHRLISNRLQIDRSPTAVRHIRRHHDFGVRVLNAAAERPSAETGVYHTVNRTDAGTGQHGCNAFDGQGHIDDDAVAFPHPQGFERIGHTVHTAQELSV